MDLYRLYEINSEYVEVIGIFQDIDIARKTICLLPKKEYPYLYVIDTYCISETSDLLNPLICPSGNI